MADQEQTATQEARPRATAEATETHKYLGPSDSFYTEVGGKAYHPGDMVTMTRARFQHCVDHGEWFEGFDFLSRRQGESADITHEFKR